MQRPQRVSPRQCACRVRGDFLTVRLHHSYAGESPVAPKILSQVLRATGIVSAAYSQMVQK